MDNYVTKRMSPTFILKLLIKVNTHSKNAGFCKQFLNSEVRLAGVGAEDNRQRGQQPGRSCLLQFGATRLLPQKQPVDNERAHHRPVKSKQDTHPLPTQDSPLQQILRAVSD